MKYSLKILVLVFVMIIFLAMPVSALDFGWDNYKVYDSKVNLGKLSIWDYGQLGSDTKLSEYILESNTERCMSNCQASGSVTLYYDGKLFSKLRFKDTEKEWTNIQREKIYVNSSEQYEKLEYEYTYDEKARGYDRRVSGSQTKHREVWNEYNGEVLDAGAYGWKIKGSIGINQQVDWVASAWGEDFNEWAWWNASSYIYKKAITGLNDTLPLPINASGPLDGTSPSDLDGNGYFEWIYGTCQGAGISVYYQNENDTRIANDTTECFKIQTNINSTNLSITGNQPSYYSSQNLTAWYPLDNNFSTGTNQKATRVVDVSIRSINATANLGVEKAILNGTMFAGYRFGFGAGVGNDGFFNTTVDSESPVTGPYGSAVIWMKSNDNCTSASHERYILSADGTDDWFISQKTTGCDFRVGGTQITTGTANTENWFNVNETMMFTLTWDTVNDNYYVYKNTTELYANTTVDTTLANTTGIFTIGISSDGDVAYSWYGEMYDIKFFNYPLSTSEIAVLYNMGTSLGSQEEIIPLNMSVALDSPGDDFNTTETSLWFSANFTTSTIANLTNMTLYIWNPDNSLNNTNVTTGIFGINNVSNLSMSGFSVADGWEWNFFGCASNVSTYNCSFQLSGNRTFDIKAFIESVSYYKTTTYETKTEYYEFNITTNGSVPVSAYLNYNGTDYAALVTNIAGDRYNINTTVDIPLTDPEENRTSYFHFQFGNSFYNLSTFNQTTNPINFSFCDANNNIPFINVTFVDGSNDTAMAGRIDSSTWYYWIDGGSASANRTLTYKSSTANLGYAFCFKPTDEDLRVEVSQFQYFNTGYTQRRHKRAARTYANSTIANLTLYLLSTSDGQYSTYAVQTSSGSPISAVDVTAERQVGGSWLLIESGTTDDAGSVVFWLNPDYDHRLTFTKAGYTTVQNTIRPSSSVYSVIMSTVDGDASFNSSIEGIKWIFYPKLGRLGKSSIHTFGFNVTSSLNNLANCKMETIAEDVVINTSTIGTTTTASCNISTTLNLSVVNYKLFGKYYLDIGDGYFVLDSDAYWITNITDYTSSGTLWSALNKLRTLKQFGDEDGRQEYSRIVFVFLLLVISWSFISYSTGWDFQTPGGVIWFLFGIITMLSFTGFMKLSNVTPWDITDKFIVAFILFLIASGYTLNNTRRYGG